ncbi:MAG: hypothetical protein ABEJ92_07275 [Halobacteriales archaeon]
MPPHQLPDAPAGRLRWALDESLDVAGILLVWAGVAALLWVGLTLLRVVLARLGAESLRLLYELLQRVDLLWPAVTWLAVATTALHVVVRAGTLLIDRSRATG